MQIGIINRTQSNVEMLTEIKNLWTVILFGERIESAGDSASIMHLVLDYRGYSEKVKMKGIFKTLREQGREEEEIAQYENMYKEIMSFRTIKGKNKQQLDISNRGERIVKEFLSIQNNTFIDGLTFYKIKELLPFSFTDMVNSDKSLLLWYYPAGEDENSVNIGIRVIEERISGDKTVFLFPDTITQHIAPIEMNRCKQATTDNTFLSDLIYTIPAPESLSTGQISILRNTFSTISWELFNQMETLFLPFSAITFSSENYETLVTLYREKTEELKIKLQEAIDKNEFLNQLKAESKDNLNYSLYAGITSFEGISLMYKNLNIISDATMMYINEMVSEKNNIKNSRLFLYVKKE